VALQSSCEANWAKLAIEKVYQVHSFTRITRNALIEFLWQLFCYGKRRYRPQTISATPYRPQSVSRFHTLSKPGRPVRSGVEGSGVADGIAKNLKWTICGIAIAVDAPNRSTTVHSDAHTTQWYLIRFLVVVDMTDSVSVTRHCLPFSF